MDEPSLEITRLQAFQELILTKVLPPFHFSKSMAHWCRQKYTPYFATIFVVSFLIYDYKRQHPEETSQSACASGQDAEGSLLRAG